jgi:H+/Cl- antiporter ClcA
MTQINININTNIMLGDILGFLGIYVYSFWLLQQFFTKSDIVSSIVLCTMLYIIIASISIVHCLWRFEIGD